MSFRRIESSASLGAMSAASCENAGGEWDLNDDWQISNHGFPCPKTALLGCIVHSLSFGHLQIINRGAIIFDSSSGIIEALLDFEKESGKRQEILDSSPDTMQVIDHGCKLILPGFVDAHCHAPQYVFAGTGMDLPLLAWLEKYTFPCESRFRDVNFARKAYEKAVKRHLKCGTTFVSYFATIHPDACKVLVDVLDRVGQRAHVGKVSMDRNCPDFYCEESAEKAIEEAEEFVRYVLGRTEHGQMILDQADGGPGAAGKGAKSNAAVNVNSNNNSDFVLDVSMHSVASTNSNLGGVDQQNNSNKRRKRSVSFYETSTATFSTTSTTVADDDEEEQADEQQAASVTKQMKLQTLTSTLSSDALDTTHHGGSSSSSSSSKQAQLPARKRAVSDMLDSTACSPSPSSSQLNNKQANPLTLLNSYETPRILPVITPRFVPTCTSQLMSGLGKLATRYSLPVQSHMSESENEIAWVKDLHPEADCYAHVYELHGLLTPSATSATYLAHCCHSSTEERLIMARTGAGAVHCASSNFMLSSGVMDVRQFLEDGIQVAVGTDVAGGYSPSMLDAFRQTIIASRVKGFDYRMDEKRKKECEIMVEEAKKKAMKDMQADLLEVAVAENMSATNNQADKQANKKVADQLNASNHSGYTNSDTTSGSSSNDSLDSDSNDSSSPPALLPATITDEEATASCSPTLLLAEAAADPVAAPAQAEAAPVPVQATTKQPYRSLNYTEVYHLCTVGGAQVLGMGQVLGNFLPGKIFDGLVVDVLHAKNNPIDNFLEEETSNGPSALELFEKFLFLGDDRNIEQVYIQGKRVI